MPRTRQQAASKIAPGSIAQLTSVFDALPEKPKETYTLREAVSQLDAPIRTALSRGYSYDEIAAILAEHEIVISAFSLKRYLSLNKGQQGEQAGAEQKKRRRGRQPKAALKAATQTLDVNPEPLEPLEATPKRRDRAKAADSKQAEVPQSVDNLLMPQPEAESAPRRRGRTSKTAAKAKPSAQTTRRTGKGRGQK